MRLTLSGYKLMNIGIFSYNKSPFLEKKYLRECRTENTFSQKYFELYNLYFDLSVISRLSLFIVCYEAALESLGVLFTAPFNPISYFNQHIILFLFTIRSYLVNKKKISAL